MRLYRPQAGSGPSGARLPRRPVTVPQAHYWRRMATELHAGASVTPVAAGGIGPSFLPGALISMTAAAGPQGAGEWWEVNLITVTIGGTPVAPLVTQQISAQATAGTTTPPPPIVAQAWLAAGGMNLHLLAQTTQGGYDTLEAGGQQVHPGETISVTWWSTVGPGFPGLGSIVIRGTRHTLSDT